jgi:phenylpropionate dioxygenase-like ring-hydroxylating dioxygenase large terminal subunit
MNEMSPANPLFWSRTAEKCPFPIPVGWFFVDYSESIRPGDHRNIFMLDQEWVFFRTEGGEPGLADPFCPHLGAHIGHGGKVVGETIRCPFHHWGYNAQGWCKSIPYATEMPPITQRQPILRTLPLVERWGLIFAWHHPHGDAPLWELPNIPELESEEYITPHRRSWPINTAIQELAENGVDYPHLKFLHGAAEMPSGDYKTDGPNAYVDIGNGYTVGHQQGPGLAIFRFAAQGITSTMISYTVPISKEKSMMNMSFTHRKYPDGSKEAQVAQHLVNHMIGEADGEESAGFESVDLIVWNNKKYRQKPILCDGDGPILRYRQWFRQFYVDADPTKI